MTAGALTERARSTIRATSERVTPARVRVLVTLLGAHQALSHHEIEELLAAEAAIDRVTVYRVLDWLVAQGVAHRVSGVDRMWRFSIASAGHDRHAHFQCNHCGKVLCLAALGAKPVNLPRGYRSETVEMTVRGRCAGCSR